LYYLESIKMELQHYKFGASWEMDFYSNSILAPYRKAIIKFHNRLLRVASKTGLTVDELYTIWFNCAHAMNNNHFFRYIMFDEKFRNTMIRRILKEEDV